MKVRAENLKNPSFDAVPILRGNIVILQLSPKVIILPARVWTKDQGVLLSAYPRRILTAALPRWSRNVHTLLEESLSVYHLQLGKSPNVKDAKTSSNSVVSWRHWRRSTVTWWHRHNLHYTNADILASCYLPQIMTPINRLHVLWIFSFNTRRYAVLTLKKPYITAPCHTNSYVDYSHLPSNRLWEFSPKRHTYCCTIWRAISWATRILYLLLKTVTVNKCTSCKSSSHHSCLDMDTANALQPTPFLLPFRYLNKPWLIDRIRKIATRLKPLFFRDLVY